MALLADKWAVGAINRPLRLVACLQIIHTPPYHPGIKQGTALSSHPLKGDGSSRAGLVNCGCKTTDEKQAGIRFKFLSSKTMKRTHQETTKSRFTPLPSASYNVVTHNARGSKNV